MNLPSLTRLLMEAKPFKVRGVGRITGAPNVMDVHFDNYVEDDLLRFVHEFLKAAPELITACEERDRYKADLDCLLKYIETGMHGFQYEGLAFIKFKYRKVFGEAVPIRDLTPSLRKRLDGKRRGKN